MPSPAQRDLPYRMRDLVRLTDVSAPTIHFYAQQGLLPPSTKTGENQAVYAESTVDRIRWIRAVQTELRLPLRRIAWIVERHGELPIAEISALQAVGRLLDEPDPPVSAADLKRVRSGLEPGDFATLVDTGLIALVDDTVSTADLRLIETVAGLRAAGFTTANGFPAERIALYREAVDALVTEELRTFVEPLLTRESSEAVRDMIGRGLPLANQLLTLLHQRAVRTEAQRWLEEDGALGTVRSV